MTTVVCACVLMWGSTGLPRYLSVETLPAADAAREEGCAARGAQRAVKTAHTDKLARRGAGAPVRGRSARRRTSIVGETVARVATSNSTVEFLARSYPHAAM